MSISQHRVRQRSWGDRPLPAWHLDYPVAAIGAYTTIFIEAFYLTIVGDFADAGPLTISILTNGFAVCLAGFGGSRAMPLAVATILVITLFLLVSITFRGHGKDFDGTYALLCAVAHLLHQCVVLWEVSQHEGLSARKQSDEESKEGGMSMPFSRDLAFHFGKYFQVEGGILLFLTLGTAMTYRIFDFNLGFGLVFASLSAALSMAVVVFVNWARPLGWAITTSGAVVRFYVVPFLLLSPVSFVFFTYADIDIAIPWWKPAVGVAWYVTLCELLAIWLMNHRLCFVIRTLISYCRLFVHVHFRQCTACHWRDNNRDQSFPSGTNYPWNDSLIVTSGEIQDQHRTIFKLEYIHQHNRVGYIQLNDETLILLKPTLLTLTMCVSLTFTLLDSIISSSLEYGSVYVIPLRVTCSAVEFYSVLALTLATVETCDGVQRKTNFTTSLLFTMLLHLYFVSPSMVDISPYLVYMVHVTTSVACIAVAPLLIAGISKPHDTSVEEKNGDVEAVATGRTSSDISIWHIDSTFIYSSHRIRCLDLRILTMGMGVILSEAVWNHGYLLTSNVWKIPSLTTISLMVLMNFVPPTRTIEPQILAIAAIMLIGVLNYYDLLILLNTSSDDFLDERAASNSDPVISASWYASLLSMIMTSGSPVCHEKTQAQLPNTTPHTDHQLLVSLRIRKPGFALLWQLRNSRVVTALAYAFIASLLGPNLPLPIHAIIASLSLMILVIGFRLENKEIDPANEPINSGHLAALGLSVCVTASAVLLRWWGILEVGNEWNVGSGAAYISYALASRLLERFRNRSREKGDNDEQTHLAQVTGNNQMEKETFGG